MENFKIIQETFIKGIGLIINDKVKVFKYIPMEINFKDYGIKIKKMVMGFISVIMIIIFEAFS